jgi:NAD(P)-dependent dehydrogenase (short-subunit alcohol dehydrogenase family)
MGCFGRNSTALEIARSVDLRGRTAVLTGASSGIGRETARALAVAGANLIIGVRNLELGKSAASEIVADAKRAIRVYAVDLSDLESVTRFAEKVDGPIDLLIANAGVSKTPDTHLKNCLDVRFATNHLGHFYLALRLRRQLADGGARIVVVSSAAHKGMMLRMDDLQWRRREHTLAAYGASKTANILFAQEATRRWSKDGIFANAVLPGSAFTGLQRYHSEEMKRRIGFILADGSVNPAMKTVECAAATTLWAAVAPELEGRGGLVLEDCAEAAIVGADTHSWSGFDPQVADPEMAAQLWEHSLSLVAEIGGCSQ